LAAELKEAYPGVDIIMVPSSGGVFEVTADGAVIFSKRAEKRHVEPGEVLERLRAARTQT
jgi:selT/selW/selH-like putative selenoprotein